MPLTTDKIHIQHLVEICRMKGLTEVVLSPGSRNAPLTIAFDSISTFNIQVIVDERVAAFYALGKAQQLQNPVILICTSGTALLNYSPAVAEAFYQHVPLLILSADRPEEWIDQGAGQSIRQEGAFRNFIRGSYTLPQDINPENKSLWYSNRLVNEAINTSRFPIKGPVHINIPLAEPLYNRVEFADQKPKIQDIHPAKLDIPNSLGVELKTLWQNAKRKLVFCSQTNPDKSLSSLLGTLQEQDDVVIWTENLANVNIKNQISCVDRFIESVHAEDWEDLKPDILLTLGNAVVSKKFRFLMRKFSAIHHWHVSDEVEEVDRYMRLRRTIHAKPQRFIQFLSRSEATKSRPYQGLWHFQNIAAKERHEEYLSTIPFCDLKAFEIILKNTPSGILQLGNSTIVRYSQLFDQRTDITYYSNRGTSGIDGCLSTAMGAASARTEQCTFISGDLSFLYDSNALWSGIMNANLKVIIIANGGGSIFKFIQGPDTIEKIDEYFVANPDVNLKTLIKSMGWSTLYSNDLKTLNEGLLKLYSSEQYSFLIVDTIKKENEKILKHYFKYLKA